jgi:hypothetical protein
MVPRTSWYFGIKVTAALVPGPAHRLNDFLLMAHPHAGAADEVVPS